MLKCRSYSHRIIFKSIVINILGVIVATIMWAKLSYIPDRKDIWWGSFIGVLSFMILFLIVICILKIMFNKNKIYYINYNEKWIRKGNKKFSFKYLTIIKIEKTLTHRLFGLVTIKLKSPYGKIVLKDVPEKIENYIRGKY